MDMILVIFDSNLDRLLIKNHYWTSFFSADGFSVVVEYSSYVGLDSWRQGTEFYSTCGRICFHHIYSEK